MSPNPGIQAEIDLKFPTPEGLVPAPAVFADDFGSILLQTIRLKDSAGMVDAETVADTTQYLVDTLIVFLLRSDVTDMQRAQFNAIIGGEIEYLFSRDTTLQDDLVVDYSRKFPDIHRTLLALMSLRTGPGSGGVGTGTDAISGPGGGMGALAFAGRTIGSIAGVGLIAWVGLSSLPAAALLGVFFAVGWYVSLSGTGSHYSVEVGGIDDKSGKPGFDVATWNTLAASADRWKNYCYKLPEGDTANDIPAAHVSAYQEIGQPETDSTKFRNVTSRKVKDQQGNKWMLYQGDWAPMGGSAFRFYRLKTIQGDEPGTRNIAIVLHPDLEVDESVGDKGAIVIITEYKGTAPSAGRLWRPVLGLRVYWRSDPANKMIFYSFHSETTERAEEEGESDASLAAFKELFTRAALTTIQMRSPAAWAIVGDYNVEPDLPGVAASGRRVFPTDPKEPTYFQTDAARRSGALDKRYDYMVAGPGIASAPTEVKRLDYLGPYRNSEGHRITDRSDHFAVWFRVPPS